MAEALIEREARLRALIETSLEAKLAHRCFKPLFANENFARMFGFENVEDVLEQTHVSQLFDARTRQDPAAAWRALLSADSDTASQDSRQILRRRDGSSFQARVTARVSPWEDGPAVTIAVLDVSREEASRRQARETRRRVIDAATYDLRTPLHAAIVRLQLLSAADLGRRPASLAADALAACGQMLDAIDQMLEDAANAPGLAATLKHPNLAPAASRKGLSRRDILVVGEDSETRLLLRLALERLGARAHLAADGRQAVRALGLRGYDLVLMDLNMIGLDGFAAARLIRDLNAPWANVPIVALTEDCPIDLAERVAAAGMDGLLFKPIDIAKLDETIARLATHETPDLVHPAERDEVQAGHDNQEADNYIDRDHDFHPAANPSRMS